MRVRSALLPLLAVILTALNLRTAITGFPPLLDTIGLELGFGPELYGVLGTIVTASFAVFGLLSSIVARRLGLERTLGLAVALTTAGILLRATAESTPVLVASTVVAAVGVGASNVLVIPLIKKYFAPQLKAMSTLFIALQQTGQFVAPLIAVPVSLAWGWRWALGLWAVMTAVGVILLVALAVRAARASATATAEQQATTAQTTDAHPPRLVGAWRTPLLWSLVLLMGMTSLNVYAIITWLPTILGDAGVDRAAGGALLALFSVFGLPAAFVVPPLAIRMRNPFIIVAICAAFMVAGYVGLLVSPGVGSVLWVIFLGLGVNTFPLCLTLVNARTRTTQGSTLLSGAMQGLGYAIACIGPLMIGALYTASRSWTASFVVLFASLAVLVGAGWVACRPSALEDQAERSDHRALS